MTKTIVNAGVDAQTGFALQRNIALYLLLENYEEKFKNRHYFICLEHHDDFLFCFLNEDNEAEIIEAYQSKKKSPNSWKLDDELCQIITKLLNTGKSLIKDDIPKSESYKHILFFATNQTIELQIKEKGCPIISHSIKEDNPSAEFAVLNQKIKDKIKNRINDLDLEIELNNLRFVWIDLNRTVEKQENELVGQLENVFCDKISNYRAAIKTLLSLFRDIEEKYNKGNEAKLLDETKRVTSQQIEEVFNVLTTKSKCFDYWRSQTNNISQVLKIKPFEGETFKLNFESAFDLFKSIKEAEHRRILDFVRSNYTKCGTYIVEECISELINMFKRQETTYFEDKKLKAILFAAYFEVTDNHPEWK